MQAKWKKCKADGEKHISSYQEVVPYERGPGEPYRLVLLVGMYKMHCKFEFSWCYPRSHWVRVGVTQRGKQPFTLTSGAIWTH